MLNKDHSTDGLLLGEPAAVAWREDDWDALLHAIYRGTCTPFLGAGACSEVLPLGSEIARDWAKRYGYPFTDRSNLVRVAQYLAVRQDPDFPKSLIQMEFANRGLPRFDQEGEPHRVLASLPFSIYLTTNYDDFMTRALTLQERPPEVGVCNWHLAGQRECDTPREEGLEAPFEPTQARPLVYHLHGVLRDFDTMVLTEDDYIDFLVNMSEARDQRDLIPRPVMNAIRDSHLLFMGYSFEDLNFKVLFRRLARYIRRDRRAHHVAVQLEPKGDEPTPEEIQLALDQRAYLEEKYSLWHINFFWGSCREFAEALWRRWQSWPPKGKKDVG